MNKNEKYDGSPSKVRSIVSKPFSAIRGKIGKKGLRYLPATVIVFGFALVGVILTVASHAATSSATKEAESGVIAGAAAPVADATAAKASGTSYVKFGTAATTPPPTGTPPPPPAAIVPTGNIPGPWTTIFDDEFDGTALDTAKWGAEKSNSNNPGDETACYDPSAVSVTGGNLEISLTAQSCGNGPNKGGEIHSIAQQPYGFYEARMNLPGGGGKTYNFPAFWLNDDNQCWPIAGEIDIMETIGGGAKSSVASPTGCNGQPNWQQKDGGGGNWSGWHTFAVDFEANGITPYYDGKSLGTMTNNGSKGPMNLKVDNTSRPMGGQTVTNTKIQVDYVRGWKKG